MGRLVALSDTHTHKIDVPSGDVLIHAGDLTNTGSVAELNKALMWLGSLPHRRKIVVPGNHDLGFHTELNFWRYVASEHGIELLTHSAIGKCFFSSWTPAFGRTGAFMAPGAMTSL